MVESAVLGSKAKGRAFSLFSDNSESDEDEGVSVERVDDFLGQMLRAMAKNRMTASSTKMARRSALEKVRRSWRNTF